MTRHSDELAAVVGQVSLSAAAIENAVNRLIRIDAARLDSLINERQSAPASALSMTWQSQTSGVHVITGFYFRVPYSSTQSGVLTLGEHTFEFGDGASVMNLSPIQLVCNRSDRSLTWTQAGTESETARIEVWGYAAPLGGVVH